MVNQSIKTNTSRGKEKTGVLEGHLEISKLEEQELEKIKAVLKKMKDAVKVQKNVSMDVKKGLLKLDESVDILDSLLKKRVALEMKLQPQTQTATVTEASTSAPSISQEEEKRNVDAGSEQTSEEVAGPWETQRSRAKKKENSPKKREKRNRKPKVRRRPDAILIKPGEEETFAGVLKKIRENINPEEVGTSVQSLRRTQKGDVLIELGQQSGAQEALMEKINTVLGDAGTVKKLTPRATIEIRDLDSMTVVEDVIAAIERECKHEAGEVEVNLTESNNRGQRLAFAKMNEKAVSMLLETSRIKIGWVNCRMRRKTVVDRCYRCLGYGHRSSNCKGPDRREHCFRCGQKGHKAKDCKGVLKCMLCTEKELTNSDHVPGTGKCEVFRKALEHAKSRSA
ncbi:uncharacterized protein [Rhodnius prolixus]|uniref:uncharacterized protein n=1 Tax=Rhodnius prolixus TaxID=13249 RepID=UPI003D18DF00